MQAQEREKIIHLASSDLPTFDAALSARGGAKTTQITVACLSLAAATLLVLTAPHAAALLASLILCTSFFAVVVTRLLASAAAIGSAVPRRLAVEDARLPVYSIIVALHHEAPVVAQLISALDRIDYPRAKLEIKIVVEADDTETFAALAAHRRSSRYEILVAPAGLPRTKPRALNLALPLLRGEFAAVFDAEDIPDPAQIRMAAERFTAAPRTLACLQASLVIDNCEDGWLPRLFALEYAALFDVLNVGLADLGWPFPLGGSSNHFRISALRELHGWDAWNVTEDADLGFRLARFGYRAETLNSTTLEEAPAQLTAWFRQRRRWFKGLYQTMITLTRDPARLLRELGFVRTAVIWAILTASVLAPLVGPLSTALLFLEINSQGWPRPESSARNGLCDIMGLRRPRWPSRAVLAHSARHAAAASHRSLACPSPAFSLSIAHRCSGLDRALRPCGKAPPLVQDRTWVCPQLAPSHRRTFIKAGDGPDHNGFGLYRSKIMNAFDSNNLERERDHVYATA